MNPIQSTGSYYKDDIVKKEMRKLLAASPKGIGSEEFVGRIREATKVSRGKIFSMIKKFESLGYMRIDRGEDRRKAIYFPNLQKVKTEQRLTEGMDFIHSLLSESNTGFGEAETKSSVIRVRVSIFTNRIDKSSQSLEDTARAVAKQFSSGFDKMVRKNLRIRPSTKSAYIITMETGEGVES